MKYLLADDYKTPVPTDDLMAFARLIDDREARLVAYSEIRGMGTVSTVFLALDHNCNPANPALWETAVVYTKAGLRKLGHPKEIRPGLYNIVGRSSTFDEAFKGHVAVVGALIGSTGISERRVCTTYGKWNGLSGHTIDLSGVRVIRVSP